MKAKSLKRDRKGMNRVMFTEVPKSALLFFVDGAPCG